MPTKIINILPDDKFDEILDLFKKASAEEVIFVIHKRHKALGEEDHFVQLAEAVEEHGKGVLILTSNPQVNDWALKYKFGVLTSHKKDPPRVLSKPNKKEDEDDDQEDDDQEDDEDDDDPDETSESEQGDNGDDGINSNHNSGFASGSNCEVYAKSEEEPEEHQAENNSERVELAVSKRPNKMISDIVRPGIDGEKVKIGISKKTERPSNVNINKEIPSPGSVDEIESIWQSKPKDEDREVFFKMPRLSRPALSFKPRFSLANLDRKTLTFLGAGVVILFGIIIFVSTGSAEIIVRPKVSPLNFSLKVSSADKFLSVSTSLKRIPGQLFSINKKTEQTFQATGERDVVQKARGKITVYNEYGTMPQVLIATTRFESESGLIFRTLKTITVPGTTVQNCKIIPGTIEVEVIAEKACDTYNIPAAKFTIPAFKEKGDSDRYQKFYGKSEEATKGGIIGKSKVVTEQDYMTAKQKMEERLKTEIGEDLKQQTAGLKILTPTQPDIEEIKSNAQIDEATDNFIVTAKAKIKIIGLKESDLFLLINQYIGKTNNLMMLPEKLKLEFTSIQFNKETNKLDFIMAVKGPAYDKIDQDKIITDLIGKNRNEITNYFKGIESIASANVLLSPFWVRKVPTNKDKIKLTI